MSHRLNKAAFPFDKSIRLAIGGPFFVVRRFECHWFDGLSETQKPGPGEVLAGCPAGEGLVVAILKWVLEKIELVHNVIHAMRRSMAKREDSNEIPDAAAFEPVRTVMNRPASDPHRGELWLTFGECLGNGAIRSQWRVEL